MSESAPAVASSPDPASDVASSPAVDSAPAVALFYGAESPFSNFHRCEFEFQGAKYTSSEQAFMACKAIEFGDEEMLGYIRTAITPSGAKKLGRKVRGFRDKRWDEVRQEYMFQVCLAKFTQNDDLRQKLLDTGDTILAEASGRDRIWGIGLYASNPDAKLPERWRGQNLLGKTLMRVRDELGGRKRTKTSHQTE